MENAREKGGVCLGLYIKSEKNLEKIERAIYSKVNDDPDFYLWCVYQFIGLLLRNSRSSESKKTNLVSAFQEVKEGKIGWEAEIYKETKRKILEIDDYLVNPFEISEGINQCHCGSKKTWSFTKQTRSADEPATTFCRCVACGAKWSYSG